MSFWPFFLQLKTFLHTVISFEFICALIAVHRVSACLLKAASSFLSSRCWACQVISVHPCLAVEPSSVHRTPCVSETGWRSFLVLSAGPGWWGMWGYSGAKGSCPPNAKGSLSLKASCALGGCGSHGWHSFYHEDCGPNSGGPGVKKCLWLECPSSDYNKRQCYILLMRL